jgi:DNA adenine methylase
MKKLFKWPGGKSRELKIIKQLLPENFDNVVEPFAGSAAVAFSLEKPAVLNDLNKDIINFYNVVSEPNSFNLLQKRITNAEKFPYVLKSDTNYGKIHSLEKEFYEQREVFNSKNFVDNVKMAYSFFIIRQLCFSGMLRHNPNTGNFNVPYGWYKKFTNNLTNKHQVFLNNSTITNNDYKKCIQDNDKENTWIFLDPPYRQRAGYPTGDWNDNHHIELANTLKACKSAKWMLVHCDDDLYRELYKDYNTFSKDFNYSIAFKDRNINSRKVNHLYIMNY